MKLRASGEDYLEAILVLQRQKGMVRSVDVARHLEVSKPSVSHAVTTLKEGGFLTMDEDFFLHLTDLGRETIENLKRAAETLNFLTEHGIGSLEDLSERCDGAAAATARVKADLRATKKEMERLTLTMKHAATYRQLRPLYEEYRQSRDKEKFLRGHEGEIILFEAAARELKRLDAVPLPATKRLRAEMDGLTARRTALQSEYRKAQREEREYDTLRQNVEALLEKPREAEPQRQRNHELE